MQLKTCTWNKIGQIALFIIIFLLGVGTVSAVPLPGQYSDGAYEVASLDYDVVPIYDGTELKEISGWNNLIYWKHRLFAEINTLAEITSQSEFVGTVILPILGALLGLCFFVIFSRRNSPEKDPASTPAKILRYLKEHPGSSQHQIASGIHKSRGSVAYQLFRLMDESKVDTIKVQKGTGYYLKLDELSPPAILMCAALENPHMREILELLYQHPHLTRHQIAQHLEKSPDTIYWYLTNLDSSLLTVQKKRGGHLYSLSPEAGRIYTELTHHRIS